MPSVGRIAPVVRWSLLGFPLLAIAACHQQRPIAASEVPPPQMIRVHFDPPRSLPGVEGFVRELRGTAQRVSSDSIVVEPREIHLSDATVLRLSAPQSAVAVPRDQSVVATTERRSLGRTLGLVALVGGVVGLVALIGSAGSDGSVGGY
jgi:hypothetical protein